MSIPDLTKLTGEPELSVTIGGRAYQFSELPIAALSRLQTWIREHTPHPLDSLKGHLDGLAAEDRQALLEGARVDALKWPPQVGTSAGSLALLSSEPGQIETLREGLVAHNPAATGDDARALYRQLQRQAASDAKAARKAGRVYDGEGPVQRIFAILFGLAEEEEGALPKE